MSFFLCYLLLAWGFVFGLLNAIHHIVDHEPYTASAVIACLCLTLLIGIPVWFML